MPKIFIPAELARAIVWEDTDEGKLLEKKQVGSSRWSILYEAIVAYQGKTYRACYRVGATEVQEERPWEDDKEAELIEVHQVPKTIQVWENIPD